ncbi:MAG: hypothetical protein Q7R64_02925 [bacterium]|nr:hypothetical protein [bacterium]
MKTLFTQRLWPFRYTIYLVAFALVLFSFFLSSVSAAPAPGIVLKVESGNQPTPGIAAEGARGLVYTRVNLTAIGGDVTIRSFTLMRTGGGRDGAFSSIGIEDVGDSGDPNGEHQYKVKATLTIPEGETIEIELKGNMKSNMNSYQYDRPTLSLVALDTDAQIQGTLPITGVAHTINSGLVIGSISLALGPQNPPSGDVAVLEKNVIFSSVRITIGAAEDVRLKNMYWFANGSSEDGDIVNPVGVLLYRGKAWEFPANVYFDDDGTKKYRVKMDQTVTITKGDIAEVYLKGDVGSGVGRTIKLDPDKLNGIGATYGYEVRDTTSKTSGTFTIVPAIFRISPGITSETYQGNVNLGTVTLEVLGEVADIRSITIRTKSAAPLHVSLWDADGKLVAGPADGSNSEVTFTSAGGSWELPTGKTTYTVTALTRDNFSVASVNAKGKNSKVPLKINGI